MAHPSVPLAGTSRRRRVEIEEHLRARLRAGEWNPNDLFPSQRALAGEYGVALNTLNRAVRTLQDEGWLRVVGGRGTVIAPSGEAGARGGGGYIGKEPRSAAPAGAAGTVNGRRSIPPVGLVTFPFVRELSAEPTFRLPWDAAFVHAFEFGCARDGTATRFATLERDDAAAVSSPSPEAGSGEGEAAAAPAFDERWRALTAAWRAAGMETLVLADVFYGAPLFVDALERWPWEGVLIYVGGEASRLTVAQVHYDNREFGRQAAAHLRGQGWDRLVMVYPYATDWGRRRAEGFAETGGVDAASTVWPDRPAALSAQEDVAGLEHETAGRLAEWIGAGRGPVDGPRWGVAAVNDGLAEAVRAAFGRRGWTAGREYGLMGFDDRPASRMSGLTSLRPPVEEMGWEAARLARQAGEEGRLAPRRVMLHGHLAIRSSSLREGG